MRHAGQREIGDLLAHIQIDDLTLAGVPTGAHDFGVVLGEEKVVERFGQLGPAGIQVAGQETAFLVLEVVDEPRRNVLGLGVVADLPYFRHVFQGSDEAPARRGVIDGGDARAFLARHVPDRMDLEQLEVAVQQHQGVRQVVGDGNDLAVRRDCDVAGVDAGADFGDHGQVPDVVLGDPAVARGEEDVAAVLGELRPAVQRVAAREAVDRRQAVAVEQGDVVVADFDDDEQVHHVHALERGGGLCRQAVGRVADDARSANVGFGPCRRGRYRRVDPVGERGDVLLRQFVGEGQHLRRDAAFGDGLDRVGLLQPLQALRQQRRAGDAQAIGTVADGAMLLEAFGRVGGLGAGGKQRQAASEQEFHAISSSVR